MEAYWPTLFASYLSKNGIEKLILSASPGGGGGGGGAGAVEASGDAPAEEEKKEEEEEEEEIDMGGGMDMFGGDGELICRGFAAPAPAPGFHLPLAAMVPLLCVCVD